VPLKVTVEGLVESLEQKIRRQEDKIQDTRRNKNSLFRLFIFLLN